jgi:integrase
VFARGPSYVVTWRDRGKLRSRAFRTLTEAKRFKAQADAGDTRPDSRTPFSTYAAQWTETHNGRSAKAITDATRDSYRDAITRLAVPFFGSTRMEHVDPPLVREYIAHLAAKGMAPDTVRRHYAPVRALLATAYDDGLLQRNPAAGVRVIVRDTRPAVPKRLTPEQTQALLAAMPAEHAELAYFLAATGVRISEALGARWADLGAAPSGQPVLRVARDTTKTDAGERTIPLTPETARLLTRRRSDATYAADGDPIFPTEIGTPMDDHNYRQRVFNPARKAAGLPWATPHKLRHGLASLMAERGYSPAQIAAQLGHADGGALALRVYVHPALHDAPDFVDGLLGGNAGGNTPAESDRIQDIGAVAKTA